MGDDYSGLESIYFVLNTEKLKNSFAVVNKLLERNVYDKIDHYFEVDIFICE